MEIEDRIKEEGVVYFVYYEHLGWWKKRRFVNFYNDRFDKGVPFYEIIDTWNSFAKYPEDTVYIVADEVSELSLTSQCCGGNRGQCCAQEPDDSSEVESE